VQIIYSQLVHQLDAVEPERRPQRVFQARYTWVIVANKLFRMACK
jgi:hypothetical protein